MRRRRRAAVVCIAIAAAGVASAETAWDGRVESVVDGDTLEVRVAADGGGDAPSERIRIRLAGIDAPERDQPWGRDAYAALRDRTLGRVVRINAVATDRYGRIVGEVYADDVCVGCELVRDGHAWVYRRYTDDAVLIRLEERARAEGRGLWALPPAERVPPWEWRRGRRGTTAPGRARQSPADRPEGCGAKHRCAEMRTCDEARFYLTTCGLSRLDGDGDGTPCESLCR